MRYWVIGGEYKDAHFLEIASGQPEERLGPFHSYDEAYKAWSARAWATVDNALTRFRIIREESEAA